jgi:uncharacterized protein DUF3710
VSLFKRGRRNEEVDPVAWATQDSAEERAAQDAIPAQARERGRRDQGRHDPAGSDPYDEAPYDQPEREQPTRSSSGPWDISEVESTDGLLDLGGLRIPGVDGMQLQLEFEEQTGRVTAATVALAGSAVQLQAFAAPRTEGIWDEIRAEIAASITRQGGTADEVPGPFGKELLARIPVRTSEGRTAHQPARFAGIDGPRWFLRAVFHGKAAFEENEAEDLEQLVRGIVVVRGGDAMAPRELLALRSPDMPEPEPVEEDPTARPPLEPFRRGPEISEVR